MTDERDNTPIPPPDPPADDTADQAEYAPLTIRLDHVKLVQVPVADALQKVCQMVVPEGEPPLYHAEILWALSNVFLGTATNWLAASPKDEFTFARDVILNIAGNLAAVINSAPDPNAVADEKLRIH